MREEEAELFSLKVPTDGDGDGKALLKLDNDGVECRLEADLDSMLVMVGVDEDSTDAGVGDGGRYVDGLEGGSAGSKSLQGNRGYTQGDSSSGKTDPPSTRATGGENTEDVVDGGKDDDDIYHTFLAG